MNVKFCLLTVKKGEKVLYTLFCTEILAVDPSTGTLVVSDNELLDELDFVERYGHEDAERNFFIVKNV